MNNHNKAAAPCQAGGSVQWKAVAAPLYSSTKKFATVEDGSYAVARIARRFHINAATARELCRMAGLGVR